MELKQKNRNLLLAQLPGLIVGGLLGGIVGYFARAVLAWVG